MSIDTSAAPSTSFSPNSRASGVLLHVTSLPSPYGIGDFGPSAFQWIDRLHNSGQAWWQVLPIGPTGYANSPYQPLSSFAINWLLVSPGRLIEDGLLAANDLERPSFPEGSVDYQQVGKFKQRLLDVVWSNFSAGARRDLLAPYDNFRHEQAGWLEDYALFQALKTKFDGIYYLKWPTALIQRSPSAIAQARLELSAQIDKGCFAQFLLFRQADQLKQYARSKGIGLIGDMPFFVSPDSSDVWSDPEYFLLDADRKPRFVAGVPPDYFSAEGQRWGNPVFDWQALRRSGYDWCIRRLRTLLAHVDTIRLDHFRGFAAAWQIPASESTARVGNWVPGPGAEFLDSARKGLGGLPFIAEDLGFITPDVSALRDQFHLPGTKVLQFAFDGQSDNPHLPENYTTNAVVYTATHDNDTTRGWFESLQQAQREAVYNTLKRGPVENTEIAFDLIQVAWSSVAALAIAPLQDLLNLGSEARMNLPGRVDGNWRWRSTPDMWAAPAFDRLRELTVTTRRQAVI